ncbi:UDP-3-O-[3-hydroxymyristoyl] glucosamine N-acyltransferase [Lacunisphaera limnophila]|uniref:UDP-3-O-[3-hydroxymyristoyl] glucosamine N-acyltransferase n=1 Tax=Lacunisphaera limnophila TaxID=1838286 RepID=A0A1D8AU04_9BACT|nr:gamma carbonic anhydrase family protein [Lacunisphaera limnophila]AOS44371.1 UDP-3-O-[3-hydroxymyristoyl] glucosamine N-acyltransferase [Lacunisphaera limnophila]
MILSHQGKCPQIHPSAYIAPTATLCGDVTVGAHCRIMFGACLIAEGGSIVIGSHGIVLENAVIRSTALHSVTIGNHCLVGPNAHLAGCTLEDEVFIATGACVFHAGILRARSEVRVNGVVHLKTELPEDATVPIGWVAVGSPVTILPPDQHERIWEIQKPLNFPLAVYGIERSEASMTRITERMATFLGSHADDHTSLTLSAQRPECP